MKSQSQKSPTHNKTNQQQSRKLSKPDNKRIESGRPSQHQEFQLSKIANDSHGNQVAQLSAIANGPVVQLGIMDKIRKLRAKGRKKKQDVTDLGQGIYHGGGISSRYSRLGAPTEQDHYDDIMDEEAEERQRDIDHPVANRVRKYGLGAAKVGLKAAAEVGGDATGVPLAGSAAKKVVGFGVDKLDDHLKKNMTSGRAYKVLRERDEEDN